MLCLRIGVTQCDETEYGQRRYKCHSIALSVVSNRRIHLCIRRRPVTDPNEVRHVDFEWAPRTPGNSREGLMRVHLRVAFLSGG